MTWNKFRQSKYPAITMAIFLAILVGFIEYHIANAIDNYYAHHSKPEKENP